MNWDGNGAFQRAHHWKAEAQQGIKLNPERLDEEFDNFKKGLEACLTSSGETKAKRNLSMDNLKHTNVGEGSELNHYARIDQVQNRNFSDGGISKGEKNHYEIHIFPEINALKRGQHFYFFAHQSNDSQSFLKLNQFDKKPIYKRGNGELFLNDIVKGGMIEVIYDGEAFQLLSAAENPTILFPDQITEIKEQLIPTGMIVAFAAIQAPKGWLICDGRSLNANESVQFKALFDLIGTHYGGTSIKNFYLPDLRGRVVAGIEGATGRFELMMDESKIGAVGGRATHSLTLSEIPEHDHGIGGLHRASTTHQSAILSHVKPEISSCKSGGGQAHNNLQPTIVLTYMIKI